METQENGSSEYSSFSACEAAMVDKHKSPFENAVDDELRMHIEQQLCKVPEPYRTTIVLRDIEELSYEEIAEITQVSLGTVKSRITRGRDALRKVLTDYVNVAGPLFGLAVAETPSDRTSGRHIRSQSIEVTP